MLKNPFIQADIAVIVPEVTMNTYVNYVYRNRIPQFLG